MDNLYCGGRIGLEWKCRAADGRATRWRRVYHKLDGLVICRWNYNVTKAKIHIRFIAHILSVHALARSCQFQSGPSRAALASDTGIKTHSFRNLI
jgi:hypothetical protein